MKKLLAILFLSATCYGSPCPLSTYPENRKLDQDMQRICDMIYNPQINYAQVSSGTWIFLAASSITVSGTIVASSGTVNSLTASSGTIQSFMVVGTATNNNAPTGRIGQQIESVASFTNTPASNAYGDLTSIVLTGGDWDSNVFVECDINGATWSGQINLIGTVSGNDSTGLVAGSNFVEANWANSATTPADTIYSINNFRISTATGGTYYLKYRATYSAGGPPQCRGRISARRAR